MDLGRCRTCGRPVTPGEVSGLGILRPRPASAGGPVIELECPGCKTVLTLIPHGNGRYAFPGQPPPPAPTEADRAAPWHRGRMNSGRDAGPGSEDDPSPGPPPPPRSAPPPRSSPPPSASTGSRPPRAAAHDRRPPAPEPRPPAGAPGERLSEAPIRTVAQAREVLGLADGIDRAGVEAAYRERALTCHPDKVAHLDADFVRLAEWKFRRIQTARDLLLASLRDGAHPGR